MKMAWPQNIEHVQTFPFFRLCIVVPSILDKSSTILLTLQGAAILIFS